MSICHGAARNTIGNFRTFGKSLDFDRQITQLMKSFNVFRMSIFIEGIMNKQLVFFHNIFNRSVKEPLIEIMNQIGINEALKSVPNYKFTFREKLSTSRCPCVVQLSHSIGVHTTMRNLIEVAKQHHIIVHYLSSIFLFFISSLSATGVSSELSLSSSVQHF